MNDVSKLLLSWMVVSSLPLLGSPKCGGVGVARRLKALTIGCLLLCLGSGFVVSSSVPYHCDNCDCSIREDATLPKGNMNLHVECREGTIDWTSPHGAVRLQLLPKHTQDFRACLLITAHSNTVVVSQDTSTNLKHLRTITGKSREFCIDAYSVPVLLYIESMRTTDNTGLPVVRIEYNLEPLSERLYFDPMEECRPCTDEEILHAYCSSDYVIEGSIANVHHEVLFDETEINVHAHRIIHQAHEKLFTRGVEHDQHFVQLLRGTVIAPLKCAIEPGDDDGKFLFTGHVKLGRMRLGCAPWLDDWLRIKEQAEQEGTLQCSFE